MKNNIEVEIWKDVVGYEGVYSVSNFGRVRRNGKGKGSCVGRILMLGNHGCGYLSVGLSRSGITRTFLVHRLVAAAFLRKSKYKTFVNHKNGKKKDNRSSNLEWTNRSENMLHAIRTGLIKGYIKISPEDLITMRRLRSEGMRVDYLAKKFCIGMSYTRRLLNGSRRPIIGGTNHA